MSINTTDAVPGDGAAHDELSTVSAAYADSAAARAVLDDLEQFGLRPTVIVPMGSWSAVSDSGRPGGLFEHPLRTARTGALTLGSMTMLGSLIWLEGRHWVLYAVIGVVVGALTGWVGSAIAATAHPARDEDLLAYPGGGLTIEVEAEQPEQARLAELVMGRHRPTVFKASTRPGARPPAERVMWQHDDGLSP
ncbi:MAG TPA: hypothetical protein VK990_04695 [Acidimicrobiia bacterium]|nr:hypothetical protein [Acidimicrobiia bacterium]